MFSNLFGDHRGRRGRQIEVEVGSNINIYRPYPTSPTHPTSTFTLACEEEKKIWFFKSKIWRSSVLIEVGEVGEVGSSLLISFFSLPLSKWRGSFLPLLSLEASI